MPSVFFNGFFEGNFPLLKFSLMMRYLVLLLAVSAGVFADHAKAADFWLQANDPWVPGRIHGRSVWDASFEGAVAENRALSIGISGDRTEHLL